MQMKEELRFAAMEYGELFGIVGGTVLMLLLLVDNLDCISPTQVCSLTMCINCCIMCIHCMQIGLRIGVELLYTSYFGAGSGPILFAYLNCDGTESRLSDCSTSSSFPFGATHSSDAGVRCQGTAITGKHNDHYFLHVNSSSFSPVQLREWQCSFGEWHYSL